MLALWSVGMVLARSCALTAVAVLLAAWLNRKKQTVRHQLWEFSAEAKRGTHRQTLVVPDCFAPLRRWVLSGWQGTQLALALDATTMGLRFTVLALSVVYRGCAIPVAWTILPANVPDAWRDKWLRLLRQLRPAFPWAWTVIVLADRGLYAPWLFRRIVRLGDIRFGASTAGGSVVRTPQATYRPLLSVVPQPGTRWRGTGTAFKSLQRRLRCTLLACWEKGLNRPIIIHRGQFCAPGWPAPCVTTSS